ncbi:hypothetical protein PHYPSEUDO_002048 [Phytophthora pseudosyringae]|uniref:Protein kinase domain-containing protein n=1 Tax=Phytophthora pseudosyringae TaxID=221518 RepID=A0A8T1VVK6_9STRA|nr:hypothetical protein PHYPSEUDO_002048 [Phytophthora pseudosyringae]
MKREQLIEQQAKEEFEALQELVKTSFQTLRRDIKYGQKQSQEERQFLIETLNDVAKAKAVKSIPSLSALYISRADISFESSWFAHNETRSLHLGTLSSGAKIAIKVVNAAENNSVKGDWFENEVNRWYPLRHPNVLPMYDACHITAPRLLVLDHAEKGNFSEFLAKNRHFLWKLFLDAARGLAYLHDRKTPIVRANLKCSNLLVMADGTGVVSDFKFAFARAHSNMSGQVQASLIRWGAPECLHLGPAANARVESDVWDVRL